MTDPERADATYVEPITADVVAAILEEEHCDAVLPTLGGQTGLNLAVALSEAGVLDEFNVKLLGTPLDTIRKAEDRELFKQVLLGLGLARLRMATPALGLGLQAGRQPSMARTRGV